MKVEQKRLLDVERIAKKYMGEKNGKVAYLFARNHTITSGPLKDLRSVTEDTPAMEEFAKARGELAKEFADVDADGVPKQEIDPRTGQMRYAISRLGAFANALNKMLEEKYPQAKIDQDEIEKKTEELLEEEIDVPFFCMELRKIPGFRHDDDEDKGIIEAGDLGILFELGILYEKEEEAPKVRAVDDSGKGKEKAS